MSTDTTLITVLYPNGIDRKKDKAADRIARRFGGSPTGETGCFIGGKRDIEYAVDTAKLEGLTAAFEREGYEVRHCDKFTYLDTPANWGA